MAIDLLLVAVILQPTRKGHNRPRWALVCPSQQLQLMTNTQLRRRHYHAPRGDLWKHGLISALAGHSGRGKRWAIEPAAAPITCKGASSHTGRTRDKAYIVGCPSRNLLSLVQVTLRD